MLELEASIETVIGVGVGVGSTELQSLLTTTLTSAKAELPGVFSTIIL